MDPLSITASVIAILQATGSILSFCYGLRAGLGDAPQALSQIIRETREIRNIVEDLQSTIDDWGDPTNRDRTIRARCKSLQEPLASCLDELNWIGTKVNSSSLDGTAVSKSKTVLQALGWRLKHMEIEESLERLSRCKAVLNMAIGTQNLAILTQIERLATTLNSDVVEASSQLNKLASDYENTSLGYYEQRVVDWLSPLRPSDIHNTALKSHEAGTGSWIAHSNEFLGWIRGTTRFLLLTGPPGSGKTLLLASLVEIALNSSTQSGPENASAFVYCDFRNPDSLSTVNVLGALLGQLCMRMGTFPKELLQEYERHTRPAFQTDPSLELIQMLLIKLSRQRRVFLFVDALDEQSHQNGHELGEVLWDLSNGPGNLSVFVVGRTYPGFHRTLEDSSQIRLEDHVAQVDTDVRRYAQRRLQQDRDFQWLSTEFRLHILESLMSKSQGSFLWAQCQLDMISRSRTIKEAKRAVAKLPESLNQIYRRILAQIPQPDKAVFQKALTWLAFAVQPLTLDELWEAVAIEPGTDCIDSESRLRSPEDILDLGNNVITLAQGGQHVRLAHLSVRDYLLSASIRDDPEVCQFALSQAEGHAQLATYCLTYLSFSELSQGPSDSAEGYMERKRCLPLLKYVAKAWSYHSRYASRGQKLDGLELGFFEDRAKFMSWVQVINADANFKWNIYPRHATALYYAASFGICKVVQSLLLPSGNPETLDAPGSRFGGTPLHAAVLRGHVDIIQILLDHGADPSRGDFDKVTPLHSASAQGDVALVELLLRNNALLDARDSMDGKTPIEWAEMAGRDSVVALLRDATSRGMGELEFPASESETSSRDHGAANQLSAISEEPAVWVPVQGFFPDFYERRSGLTSSIIISVELENELTVLESGVSNHTCFLSDQSSPAVW